MSIIPIDMNSGSIRRKDTIVGIDLGTTNSLVAVIDEQTGKPKVLESGGAGVLVPSVIYFDEENRCLVGKSALKMLETAPERTIFSVKRLMGRSYQDLSEHRNFYSYDILETDESELVKVRVGNAFYSPIGLSAEILKELKYRAEKVLARPIRKAVITVPAYFNETQRQATRDAGKLAGLEVLRILNEPTAASLAYGVGLLGSNTKTVAVYDLGGGTFDVSILRIENGIYDVVATHGDTYLGGDDIDRILVEYWKHLQPEIEMIGVHELRMAAERVKIELSTCEEACVDAGEFRLFLNRDTFNTLISPLLRKTADSCQQALRDSALSQSDIDEVALVGGSTRIPAVRELVARLFPNSRINTDLDPDQVVALGAAIQADILAGNRKDTLLLDVTPLSLGIETSGGLMDVIIARNSNIPTSAAKNYTTSVDGQVNLKIAIYQGERDVVDQNRKLASFELRGIPPMPAGLPKIHVTFSLDSNGLLKVKAEELRSGIQQDVRIQPQYGLTDGQIEAMLAESLANAESDIAFRSLTEARNEAGNLLLNAEKFIRDHTAGLSIQDRMDLHRLTDQLRHQTLHGSKDEILSAIEELNDYTRPFAEKLMDEAVSSALKGRTIS